MHKFIERGIAPHRLSDPARVSMFRSFDPLADYRNVCEFSVVCCFFHRFLFVSFYNYAKRVRQRRRWLESVSDLGEIESGRLEFNDPHEMVWQLGYGLVIVYAPLNWHIT